MLKAGHFDKRNNFIRVFFVMLVRFVLKQVSDLSMAIHQKDKNFAQQI